ncbi:MAG: hypothetical protein ACOCYZ_04600 [Halococcoides sp.]
MAGLRPGDTYACGETHIQDHPTPTPAMSTATKIVLATLGGSIAGVLIVATLVLA